MRDASAHRSPSWSVHGRGLGWGVGGLCNSLCYDIRADVDCPKESSVSRVIQMKVDVWLLEGPVEMTWRVLFMGLVKKIV